MGLQQELSKQIVWKNDGAGPAGAVVAGGNQDIHIVNDHATGDPYFDMAIEGPGAANEFVRAVAQIEPPLGITTVIFRTNDEPKPKTPVIPRTNP